MVLGVLIVLGLATIAGLLRGGSLLHIAKLPLRGLVLVALAGSLQVLALTALSGHARWGPLAVVAANCLVGACLVMNRRVAGVACAFAGLAMNATVTVLNGGMPVSARAAEIAHLELAAARFDAEHALMTEDTLLAPLGDVIPIPGGHLVISIGDLLLAAGLALFVYRGMRARPPDRSTRTYNVTVAMGGGET